MLNVSRPNCLIISACNVRVQEHFRACGMPNITMSKANSACTYVADFYNLTNRKRMPPVQVELDLEEVRHHLLRTALHYAGEF